MLSDALGAIHQLTDLLGLALGQPDLGAVTATGGEIGVVVEVIVSVGANLLMTPTP